MNNDLMDMLLVQSFDLDTLIEQYRLFFMSLLPGMFVLACVVEYFDRLDGLGLVKRALVSILILTSVTSFYKESIHTSIEAANQKLEEQKQSNILLMDMFEGGIFLENLPEKKKKEFYKDNNVFTGTLKFIKYQMFDGFINDGFTVTVYFIAQICFLILKIVYSLVYYLGIGLIGIPCLIYIFPTMGNVLRGAILSYIWCLVVPHILVFILSMIGTEISKGYLDGQIIGGSATGTALLFILTLFIAFTPLVATMLVNGSGMAQAGGIIASIGANYVMNLPRNTVNNAASMMVGGPLGPKMKLAASSPNFFKKPKPNVDMRRPSAPIDGISNNGHGGSKKAMNKQSMGSFQIKRLFNSSGGGKSMNQSPGSNSQKNIKVDEIQNPTLKSNQHSSSVSKNGEKAKHVRNNQNTRIQSVRNGGKATSLKNNYKSANSKTSSNKITKRPGNN